MGTKLPMHRILYGCVIRHLFLRFCTYRNHEGFEKGSTLSIVFIVISLKKKIPDKMTNLKPQKPSSEVVDSPLLCFPQDGSVILQ